MHENSGADHCTCARTRRGRAVASRRFLLLFNAASNGGPIAADDLLQSLGDLAEGAVFDCLQELGEGVATGLDDLGEGIQLAVSMASVFAPEGAEAVDL